MDKNTILAFALIVLIWTFYSATQQRENPPPDPGQAPVESVQNGTQNPPETRPPGISGNEPGVVSGDSFSSSPAVLKVSAPETFRTLENELLKIKVGSADASFREVILKEFKTQNKKNSPPVNVVAEQGQWHPFGLILSEKIQNEIARQGFKEIEFDEEKNQISYRFVERGVVQVDRSYRLLPHSYDIEAKTKITNLSKRANLEQQPGLFWNLPSADLGKKGGFLSMLGTPPNISEPFALVGDKFQKVSVKPNERKEVSGEFSWAALGDRYFLLAVFPEWDGSSKMRSTTYTGQAGSEVQNILYSRQHQIAPGKSVDFDFRIFLGPKKLKILEGRGHKLALALDFGFFHVFAVFLLRLMQFFNQYLHNWGVSIIILTVLIKAVLYPLTHKMFKSMKEMQRIQPLIKEMQEKYKDDKEQLNVQMLKLMREHKVNPLGGCLPMFIQMPVWIALYRVLYSAIELRHAPFYFWIQDLSARDPYFITPVLMGITMVIQQKLSPKPPDPMQAKMMMLMPIFFSLIMLFLPSGLTIYIFCNTGLSILQQWTINKSFKQKTPLGELAKNEN